MELAIRDLFERAEPQLSASVASELRELHDAVDEVRQVRGAAVSHFAKWHESPDALGRIADCFDALKPNDPYAPFVAALLAEAAVADRAFQIVLDRDVSLRRAGERGDRQIALRVRTALADADGPGTWPELITKAESLRFAAAEGTYVCLRGARWCAWNGQPERAETLYRLAMSSVRKPTSIWMLRMRCGRSPCSTRLQITGMHSSRRTNWRCQSMAHARTWRGTSRTRQRSYQYMANERVPDAHLWTRYRLLESIRSGCLMDELESHGILARIYRHSGYQVLALEHAVLGGARALVKELAPNVGAWPDSLATVVDGPASWVRPAALLALKHVGDFAPPEVARELVHQLVQQLHRDADDLHAAPALFEALQAVVLEATDDDLRRMVPVLERAAPREPGGFLLTDLGVGMIAARVYRFRPSLRHRAALAARRDGNRLSHGRVVECTRRVWGRYRRTRRSN